MQHVTRRSQPDKCVLAALPGQGRRSNFCPFLHILLLSFRLPSTQPAGATEGHLGFSAPGGEAWGGGRATQTPLTGTYRSGINITPLGGRGRKEGGI